MSFKHLIIASIDLLVLLLISKVQEGKFYIILMDKVHVLCCWVNFWEDQLTKKWILDFNSQLSITTLNTALPPFKLQNPSESGRIDGTEGRCRRTEAKCRNIITSLNPKFQPKQSTSFGDNREPYPSHLDAESAFIG